MRDIKILGKFLKSIEIPLRFTQVFSRLLVFQIILHSLILLHTIILLIVSVSPSASLELLISSISPRKPETEMTNLKSIEHLMPKVMQHTIAVRS